jgi:HEPN domain-containing protein
MKNQHDLALGWFKKAASDLNTAEVILASPGPYDTVCFHAQQSAEKYLKGFLMWNGQFVPRTHDLLELNQLCISLYEYWEISEAILADLMPFAVEMRYDLDFFPEREVAAEAVALAIEVQTSVLAIVSQKSDLR